MRARAADRISTALGGPACLWIVWTWYRMWWTGGSIPLTSLTPGRGWPQVAASILVVPVAGAVMWALSALLALPFAGRP